MNEAEKTELVSAAMEIRYNDLSDPKAVDTLAKTIKLLFGTDICKTCKGDILNAYYKLGSHFQNEALFKTKKMKSKYILHDKVVLFEPNTQNVFTNKNLTDADAERILANYPAFAKRFKFIPEQPVAVSTVEKSDDVKLNEAVEYIDSVKTKAELISVCEQNGFPAEEWSKYNFLKLKKYIKTKLNEINNSPN